MLNQFSRTELLLGKEAMERLSRARVAVFGIGGVGGYTVEALVRSGVGAIDLIDDDKVCLTNLNRQIIATRSTVGKYKAEVMRDRSRHQPGLQGGGAQVLPICRRRETSSIFRAIRMSWTQSIL